MTTPAQTREAQSNLMRPSFGGTLLLPGDGGYEDARRIHNGAIDKKPAVIARCRSVQDIAAAVRFAVADGYEIAVRGGGRNVAGRCVTEGGVMIDLSLMNAVRVDPMQKTATAEGGATWAGFNAATVKTASRPPRRRHLVNWRCGPHAWRRTRMADGRARDGRGQSRERGDRDGVGRRRHLQRRGKSGSLLGDSRRGNFGIAATLTFKLHPIGIVGGVVAHPLDAAPEVLGPQTTASNDDELTLFGGLLHAPDGSGRKISAMVCFHPDAERGMKALEPVKKFGSPIMDVVGPMPYDALNGMLDGGFPRGALNYWKSSFLTELTDGHRHDDHDVRECPHRWERCSSSISTAPSHGCPWRRRSRTEDKGYNLLIVSQWMDPAQNDACIAWAHADLRHNAPPSAPGRYVNYLGDDEASSAVAATLGKTPIR